MQNTVAPSLKLRWAIFIALSLLALAIRLPQLGERPMHTDEAVNAYLTGRLLAGQPFAYDPRDRHGPALFALAEPVVRLCGATDFASLTESELRLTPVLVGSATILLFGAAVEMFGFLPCLIGALLFVFGPLSVYYSRYFIHETLFVAATFGLLISGWAAVEKNSVWRAALAGLCAALMLASKETAVIHFFALGAAALAVWLAGRRGGTASPDATAGRTTTKAFTPSVKIILVGGAVFVAAFVLLFTWFGRNWGALAELLRAVPSFAARAGGEGHEKPFGYYFALLDPHFIYFILAAAGLYAVVCDAVAGVRRASLLLAVYGVVTLLVYSFIPYKTPWLALNLWLPMVLLCGLGVEGVWQQFKGSTARWFGGIAIAALCAVTGEETKTLAFDNPAGEKNPLAYAHTVDDLLRLPPELKKLAAENHLDQPLIAVVAADPWPLPWYLRHYSRVGFWQPGQDPGSADFYITSPEAANGIELHLKNRYPEFFGLRPEVLILLWPPAAPATKPAP